MSPDEIIGDSTVIFKMFLTSLFEMSIEYPKRLLPSEMHRTYSLSVF